MKALKQKEDDGHLHLRYFDESGFSTPSSVPYGCQPAIRGHLPGFPCHPSKRLNVLGFMGRGTEFRHTGKRCVVVMDNASFHKTPAVRDKMENWLLRGVQPRFIPPYCPELKTYWTHSVASAMTYA